MPCNQLAVKIWGACDGLRGFDIGMNGAIKKMLTGADIKTMCDVYHGSIEDFERVILVERIAYPFIVNG